MKRFFRTESLKAQRGVAAVEMAIVLPIFILLLAAPLFFARYFWHYTAAQKAAHDAARYLSTVSQVEMRTPDAGGVPAAARLAEQIALIETAELDPGRLAPFVDVYCGSTRCNGLTLPTQVRVFVQMRVQDTIFDLFTYMFTGEDGILLTADVTMRYVGS